MYINEQASNLSPTILTVLDGPYRRLSVFVRGCWGLFFVYSSHCHGFRDEIHISSIESLTDLRNLTFWMTCQVDKMRDFKF